jgi:FG-GAP repeat protein
MLRRRSPAAVAVAALIGANESGRVNGECEVAHLANPAAPSDAFGAAYVFAGREHRWIGAARLAAAEPVGPNPYFGNSVTISDITNTIVVGALLDRALGQASGAAHVFRRDASGWMELVKLTASDEGPGDNFGFRVAAMTDDLVLVSALREVAGLGTVYAFAGLSGADGDANGAPDACDIFEGTAEDCNANAIPDECESVGDLNADGVVNIVDLLALLAVWGPCSSDCPLACTGNLNGDCTVNALDMCIIFDNSWSVLGMLPS